MPNRLRHFCDFCLINFWTFCLLVPIAPMFIPTNSCTMFGFRERRSQEGDRRLGSIFWCLSRWVEKKKKKAKEALERRTVSTVSLARRSHLYRQPVKFHVSFSYKWPWRHGWPHLDGWKSYVDFDAQGNMITKELRTIQVSFLVLLRIIDFFGLSLVL